MHHGREDSRLDASQSRVTGCGDWSAFWRNWAAWEVTTLLLVFSLAGCQPKSPQASSPATSTSSGNGSGAATTEAAGHGQGSAGTEADPLAKWPVPAAALVLTGEMKGYLEPCGCSLTQSGGLARRSQVMQEMRDKGWPIVGLDAGGTLKRTRRQDQIKFEALVSALSTIGYQGLALGTTELQLGPDVLLQQQVVEPAEGQNAVSLLGCNVVLFDSPDIGTPMHSKVMTVGGVTVGVTAVLGESEREVVAPADVESSISLLEPRAALKQELAVLEAQQPKVLVLLAHGTYEEGLAWAKEFPQFDIVVATGGPEDPAAKPVEVGRTWVIQPGAKGKYVGVVGLYPEASDVPRRYALVDLKSTQYEGDPAMNDVMATYQARLKEEALALAPDIEVPLAKSLSYVGAAKCGECHTQAYKKWKSTKHAKAYETLKLGREPHRADWVSRVNDPECLSCHVTGWNPQEVLRYTSGFQSEELTPHLAGQQCENCHSAGSAHSSLEAQFRADSKSVTRDELLAGRKQMKLFAVEAEKKVCIQCHDGENSPKWNFVKYWAEVAHPWKD